MKKVMCFLLLIFQHSYSCAEEDILTVDRSTPGGMQLAFPNDDNIRPKSGEFKLDNYVLMCGDNGDRWAVVTLSNLSSGNRIFEHDQLLALFANGERRFPLIFKATAKGKETLTFTLSFGQSKFPILELYTAKR